MKRIRIIATCSVIAAFTIFVHAQETSLPVQQRASRLLPAGSDAGQKVYTISHGSLSDDAKPIIHKRRVHPLAQKKIEVTTATPIVPIPVPVQNIQPAQLTDAEVKNSRLTVFGLAFGIALLGTISFLFFFLKNEKRTTALLKKSVVEKKPVPVRLHLEPKPAPPVAAKIVQLAKGRLEDEETIDEKEKESPKRGGEIELSLALQELRAKNQIIGLTKEGQKNGITKKSVGHAKKLGTGIGELELANRLAKLSKLKMQEEPT